MDSKTKQYINREADKTKLRFLFRDLIKDSETALKLEKTIYKNGLVFEVRPKENTILNKLQMEVKK